MTLFWKECINQSTGCEEIKNIENYVSACSPQSTAPIDDFYCELSELLKIATPELMKLHSYLGNLLLVGIISSTENYFRSIFANLINICPISKAKASEKTISIGSVVWQQNFDLSKVSFEHLSFADSKAIKKASRDFIDHIINEENLTSSIFSEYEKLCELRHCIVHSSAILKGKNAIKLQVPPQNSSLKTLLGYNEIQQSAAICTTLVASFNIELFSTIVTRWAVQWPKLCSTAIDSTMRKKTFKAIWDIFHSKHDKKNGLISNPLSMVKCRNCVKREYQLNS